MNCCTISVYYCLEIGQIIWLKFNCYRYHNPNDFFQLIINWINILSKWFCVCEIIIDNISFWFILKLICVRATWFLNSRRTNSSKYTLQKLYLGLCSGMTHFLRVYCYIERLTINRVVKTLMKEVTLPSLKSVFFKQHSLES